MLTATDGGNADDQDMKKRDIEILSQQATTHAQSLAKEATETAEMYAAISSITTQRNERSAQRDRLRDEIASIQKVIAQRLEAQRQHATRLDAQARFNNPELDFWTDYLCLRIEGVPGVLDRLRFIFSHIDEQDWAKEAWFDLDTAQRDYSISEYRPKMEAERLERCLEKLNENRDIGEFLKGMRELFVEVMK